MTRLEPTAEQKTAITDRGGELLVSAAAGSGKTRVLVERLFRYVEEGHRVDDFLIITYTRAAAAELRGRIAAELGARVAEQPDNGHLRRQMMRVYRADIKTVDAFCTALLRENIHLLPAVEGRSLTADFRTLDEQESLLLRTRVLQRVLEEMYDRIEAGDRRSALLVETLGAGRDDRALEELVLRLHEKIQSHPHPLQWLKKHRTWWESVPEDLSATDIGRIIMEDACRCAAFWAEQLRRAARELEDCEALYNALADRYLEMAARLDEYPAAAERGWDAMASLAPKFRSMGSVRGHEYDAEKERQKAMRERCKSDLERIRKPFETPQRDMVEDLRAMSGAMLALIDLTERFALSYQAEKVRRNCMDFSDAEHAALDILTDADGAPTPLAQQLSVRYAEVMVDEYQDTNDVQNCIFTAVSGGGRHLFAVGDVKQSIYRFRLADPTIFLEKYRAFRDAAAAADGEPRRVLLQKNFRSRRQVLSAVNYIFEQIMSPQMGEMVYGPDEKLNAGADYDDRPGLEAEAHFIDVENTPEQEFDRSTVEARFVARRIRQMLDEGYPVQGSDGKLRPLQPEDVVILMRSPRVRLKAFTDALAQENIPFSGSEEEAFFSTVEIAVMLSFLQVVDNPHQDVPLISVLRSPLFGYTPDQLARVRTLLPGGDFYEALCLDEAPETRAFLSLLQQLRSDALEQPVDRLLWQIYTRCDAMAIFGAMADGSHRKDNLVALLGYAGQIAAGGRGSLFDFVVQLRRLIELDKPPEVSARRVAAGVRIMTIHKSKGLEFPVVFLCDLSHKFNTRDDSEPVLVHPRLGLACDRVDPERRVRYATVFKTALQLALQRENKAEEMRILYVALTRAREKLILVDCRKRAASRMKTMLTLSAGPLEPEAAALANCHGDWIWLALLCTRQATPLRRYLGQYEAAPQDAPGWSVFVWRNPLTDEAAPEGTALPERRHAPEPVDEAALSAVYAHRPATQVPTKLAATQLKGREMDGEVAEGASFAPEVRFETPRFLAPEKKLTAAERGTAVHLAMQYVDFSADSEEAVAQQIDRLCRRRLMTPEQAEAVDCGRIAAFLHSPLCGRIRKAEKVYREYRFALLTDASLYDPAAAGEELMLQGVVDCAFDTPEGLVIVDFKTDRITPGEEAARAERYRGQLAAYAAALGRVLERPVAEKLLYFFATGGEISL